MALWESDLPVFTAGALDADLKLLADARDQLVAEANRARNRLVGTVLAEQHDERAVSRPHGDGDAAATAEAELTATHEVPLPAASRATARMARVYTTLRECALKSKEGDGMT